MTFLKKLQKLSYESTSEVLDSTISTMRQGFEIAAGLGDLHSGFQIYLNASQLKKLEKASLENGVLFRQTDGMPTFVFVPGSHWHSQAKMLAAVKAERRRKLIDEMPIMFKSLSVLGCLEARLHCYDLDSEEYQIAASKNGVDFIKGRETVIFRWKEGSELYSTALSNRDSALLNLSRFLMRLPNEMLISANYGFWGYVVYVSEGSAFPGAIEAVASALGVKLTSENGPYIFSWD